MFQGAKSDNGLFQVRENLETMMMTKGGRKSRDGEEGVGVRERRHDVYDLRDARLSAQAIPTANLRNRYHF